MRQFFRDSDRQLSIRWQASLACGLLAVVGCSPNVTVDSAAKSLETMHQAAIRKPAKPNESEAVTPVISELVNSESAKRMNGKEPELQAALTIHSAALVVEDADTSVYRKVIAVCPQAFRDALQPWVERRRREGLEVAVIDSEPTAEDLKRSLAQSDTSRCNYVLLVGDSQPSPNGEASNPEQYIPTIYRAADVTAAYQETPQIPGDFSYGDFDGDGIVQAAVGRLPVKTSMQLTSIVNRIIAYEDSTDFGRWRSRVDLVAGIGGFGKMIDGAIEMVAGGIITSSLPGFVHTRITHASPTSDFHPGVKEFTSTVLNNYEDGARFWVYAGHGWVNELDRVPSNQFGRPVLAMDDMPRLNRPHGSSPIALMLACYTGAFDVNEDCLAERMLLSDGGPIAVLAGSRVTMPYGNASAAMGLIHAVYHRHSERLGDAWREALVEMATPASDNAELRSRRMMVDGIASLLGGGARIDNERREHMQLYNWLGDPTLRLSTEQDVQIDDFPDAVLGRPVTISGTSPIAGKLTVEMHRRLGTPAMAADKAANAYAAANETMLTSVEQNVNAGPWSCELTSADLSRVATSSSTPIIIKVSVNGKSTHAAGSRTAWLRSPSKPATVNETPSKTSAQPPQTR